MLSIDQGCVIVQFVHIKKVKLLMFLFFLKGQYGDLFLWLRKTRQTTELFSHKTDTFLVASQKTFVPPAVTNI